jgi:hypothetical protein
MRGTISQKGHRDGGGPFRSRRKRTGPHTRSSGRRSARETGDSERSLGRPTIEPPRQSVYKSPRLVVTVSVAFYDIAFY